MALRRMALRRMAVGVPRRLAERGTSTLSSGMVHTQSLASPTGFALVPIEKRAPD